MSGKPKIGKDGRGWPDLSPQEQRRRYFCAHLPGLGARARDRLIELKVWSEISLMNITERKFRKGHYIGKSTWLEVQRLQDARRPARPPLYTGRL